MSNDDPEFGGGENAPAFETLPSLRPSLLLAPGEDVELAYIGAVLGDPDGNLFASGRMLPAAAFNNLEARKLWQALQSGIKVDDVPQLMQATGIQFARIAEFSQMDRTGVMASLHLGELWRKWRLRLKERLAKTIADAQEIQPEEWKKLIDAIDEGSGTTNSAKPLTAFEIPPEGDKSILLGNRFLNRGDGGVLVSTSGVGKSSMSLQASVCWALGRDFLGIKPNGRLKSLIIQSEDSDGDIAEVKVSIFHRMELSLSDRAEIENRVLLVTDRTHRGLAFIANLRLLIKQHKPDLVWINPLQAFIDGDITESRDIGEFLREGLNNLNEPPSFGYIVVHHTTKPQVDAGERKWFEVMYDMAGGGEIINWARFIMSLRATEDEGKFNLVLAKRGRRAGVTKRVEQGAGFRDEIVTTIALQHAHEQIEVSGQARKLNVIFWESSDHDPKPKKATGRASNGPTVEELLPVLRVPKERALNLAAIQRAFRSIRVCSPAVVSNLVIEGVSSGKLVKTGSDKEPSYYAAN